MILALRTDKPEAELYLYDATHQLCDSYSWQAHRELSTTLLEKIEALLQAYSLGQADIKGLIVYEGPGSFTGLRIGITVANTLAYAWKVPIVGSTGEQWQADGLPQLSNQQEGVIVMPHYGSEAHITEPRK